jgi:hypothetical protein
VLLCKGLFSHFLDKKTEVTFQNLGGTLLDFHPDPLRSNEIDENEFSVTLFSRVGDPHLFNADPDPSFHFIADPDPFFHFYGVPDPTFHLNADTDPH